MTASPLPPALPAARAPGFRSQPGLLKQLKRRVRTTAVRAAVALLAWLPLSLARKLGAWVGRLGYALARRERQRGLESLAQAFPKHSPQAREVLLRASFEHLGLAALEVACIRQLDAQLEREVRFEPGAREVLQRALARGRGVVFVSAHLGHWELLARRVAKEGFPCQSIARKTSDPTLTSWVERFRATGGVRTIWRGDEGAARKMLRALKGGEILGLLIDQDTDVQSVWVPFFGRLAKTPRAAADLALRTGAAVVLGFCPRGEDGRYTLELEEVTFSPSDDTEQEALALTTALTARIEAAIRRYPTQWVWMHRRWKSPPP